MIDVTGVDLVALAKKAYELSSPQGLGISHFTPEPLTDEEVRRLVERKKCYPLSMDYVKGRSIKLHVRREGDRLFVSESWYDHTKEQYRELLQSVGIEIDITTYKHGVACNCKDCRNKLYEAK